VEIKCEMNENARQYILELFSFVSTDSIVIFTRAGRLKRLNCPFFVISRVNTTYLRKGNQYAVEAVKMTLGLEDVYIIDGKAYYIWYFDIVD
jgi:hypothetical protein